MSWVITPGQKVNWDPSMITTALWLDAADASTVTTVSGYVSQWNDKSGNARHASQATAAARPSYTTARLNGLNIVTFDGNSDTLSFADLTLGANASALCYFFVMSSDNVSTTSYLPVFDLNTNTGTDRAAIYVRSSTLEAGGRRLDSDSYQFHTGGSPSNSTAFLASVLFDYSVAALSIGFNGGSLTSRAGGFQTAGNSSNTSSQSINIGSANGTSFFSGRVAEVVVTRAVPSTANRERIEGYLAHKWGLTANLPAGHPYKTQPPYI